MRQAPEDNMPDSEPSRPGQATGMRGKEIVASELEFNLNGHWGMVETPATREAQSVARQVFSHYQFVRPQALFEILTHAFDNVANYGRDSGVSRGTLRVLEVENEIVFQVENRSTTGLSQRLLAKAITPVDGIISLKKGERHPTESGGGNGIHLMTRWLPHVYRSDVVETVKTGSLRWYQNQESEGQFRVTFELRIPIPDSAEQSRLLEIQAEQQRVEQHWAAAEVVIGNWKEAKIEERDTHTLAAEIATCSRALESLANATERGENTGFRDSTILEQLKALGTHGSSAAPSLRRCMLVADTTHVSQSVLMEVEVDPEQSIQFFTENLPGLIQKIASQKDPDDRPVAAIANYARERGAICAGMQDGLLRAFDAGQARSNIAEALSAIPLSGSNRARMASSLRRALARKEGDQFEITCAADVLAGQQGLSDSEINLMMNGLTSRAACQINEALERLTLKQPQIDHANSLLKVALAADGEMELYYLCKVIERCEGNKAVLFDTVRPMLFDTRYKYSASEMLKQMSLGGEQIAALVEDTAAALRRDIAVRDGGGASERLYYPLEFLKKHAAQASVIRDTLVDALVSGVEEFSVGQILESTGIDEKQRQRILAEAARRRQRGEGSTFNLEQVLKK